MPRRHAGNVRNRVSPAKKKLAAHMGRNKSWPEKILWKQLKDKKTGYRITAQSLLFGWITDFYCPAAMLVIEVDGSYHLDPKRKALDRHRDAVMRAKGFMIVRFTAKEVMANCPAVVAIITHKIRQRLA